MPTLTEVRASRRGKGFSPDATHSATLPREYYFDPAIYEREKREIWGKNWIFVGTLNHLANVGDYITRTIVDQRIYVIRSNDGRLRAFYNVCQHRGHTLLEGDGNARMVRCPFHSWVYDSFGNLKAAPESEHVPGFEAGDFCIPEIRLETLGMMVFINLDDEARPLSEMGGAELLAQFREAIPRFDSLTYVRNEPYFVDCNWKLVLDGLECYHCPHIHPEAMGPKSGLMKNSFEFTGSKYVQRHVSRVKDPGDDDGGVMPFEIGGDDIRDVYIWFLWPNLLFAARPGASNIQILETVPLGPEKCQHNLINFCINSPPTPADYSQMNFYRDVAWPQDSAAMLRQMQGMKSQGFVRGRLMADPEHSWWSEVGTHHFDNLVWRALNGDQYETADSPAS